jgi:hypothetical protein
VVQGTCSRAVRQEGSIHNALKYTGVSHTYYSIAPPFSSLALDRKEWPASRLVSITSCKELHEKGGWIGFRSVLDAVQSRNISLLCRESSSGLSALCNSEVLGLLWALKNYRIWLQHCRLNVYAASLMSQFRSSSMSALLIIGNEKGRHCGGAQWHNILSRTER